MATAVWAPSRTGVETKTAAMATTAKLEYNTRIIRTSLLDQLTVTGSMVRKLESHTFSFGERPLC
jgi:hypothetical protein